MAMKRYEYNGFTYWFHEGEQPEGAKEVKPATKGRKAANKAADAEAKND